MCSLVHAHSLPACIGDCDPRRAVLYSFPCSVDTRLPCYFSYIMITSLFLITLHQGLHCFKHAHGHILHSVLSQVKSVSSNRAAELFVLRPDFPLGKTLILPHQSQGQGPTFPGVTPPLCEWNLWCVSGISGTP